jgi:hypothetical protein
MNEVNGSIVTKARFKALLGILWETELSAGNLDGITG